MPAALQPCLSCRGRSTVRRGLCLPCYDRLRTEVAQGEATWAELQESGQALPAKSRGERMQQWFKERPTKGT
jgi:hypothetical protein